uniref:Uncharacterized protein n=1 Tax=Rhizophora mucronata TaxID=61149 RepID=A0A2P2L5Z5_RHIMU
MMNSYKLCLPREHFL